MLRNCIALCLTLLLVPVTGCSSGQPQSASAPVEVASTQHRAAAMANVAAVYQYPGQTIIVLDRGQKDGILPHMQFRLSRDGNDLGLFVIRSVGKDTAIAAPLRLSDVVEVGDLVRLSSL